MYLLAWVVLLNVNIPVRIMLFLFAVSPLIITWMVYCVLTDTQRPYAGLGPKDEWGYADKKKDELWLF
jgi:hypothetical protein